MPNFLEQRLEQLEQRLHRLEKVLLGDKTPPVSQAEPTAKKTPPVYTPPPQSFSHQQFQTRGLESSYNWLAIIAVICFVLAGVYIIKLAIDSGWLTPRRQCGLAALLGGVLVGSGLHLRDMDKSYASFLSSTGVVVLFLSIIGAGSYYQIISGQFSLVLFAVVALLCMWLYSLFRSPVYLLVSIIGTYAAPFLLGIKNDINLINGYYLISSALYAFTSIFLNNRLITLFAAYFSFATVSLLNAGYHDPLFDAGVLALHFAIYLIGIVMHTFASRTPLDHSEACCFLPLVLFFYGLEYNSLREALGSDVNYIALAFVFALNIISFFAQKELRKAKHLASYDVVLSFSSIVAYHAFYTQILPNDFQPLVMIAAIVLAATFSFEASFIQLPLSRFVGGLLLCFILFSNSMTLMMKNMLDQGGNEWILYGFLSVIAWIYYYVKKKWKDHSISGLAMFMLFLAHVQGMLTLFRVTHEINSFAVSAAWAAYAVLILFAGYSQREKIFAQSSVVILMISAAKALLYDVSGSTAWLRIFCLLLTGAVLYGAGFALRKVNSWQSLEKTA